MFCSRRVLKLTSINIELCFTLASVSSIPREMLLLLAESMHPRPRIGSHTADSFGPEVVSLAEVDLVTIWLIESDEHLAMCSEW